MQFFRYSCVFPLLLLRLAAQDDLETNRKTIRSAFETTRESDKKMGNYLYTRHTIRKEFANDGKLRTQTELKYRRDPWEELAVMRLIERDGKPIPADELKKQEEALGKRVAELRKEGSTATAQGKAQQEEEAFLAEMPDALDFRRAGSETVDGRSLDIYEFAPRNRYQSKNIRARVFEKVKGRIWVDPKDVEIAKIDALVFDTVNVGMGLVGRIEKGTHFELERRRLENGQWLIHWQHIRFDVRVMMVKPLHRELENHWGNFVLRQNLKASHTTAFSAL